MWFYLRMVENYREDPSFKPEYSYKDRETGEEASAPFPVAVFGVDSNKTFLGVGNVIGVVETSFGDNPVIELEDIEDGQKYTILGLESWWTHPVPEEVVEHMADGSLAVDSVRRYLDELRADEELSEAADNAWLEDQGIDPES